MAAICASHTVLPSTSVSIGNGNANKSQVSSPSPPWRVSFRNRDDGIRCRTASFSLTSLPSTIKIPEVQFYPLENQKLSLIEKDEQSRRLKRVVIRMSIRDEEGVLADKLAPFREAYWRMPEGADMILRFEETIRALNYISQGISGCLLEHVDSWICGYSLVALKDYGDEFDKELHKLEPIMVKLFVGKGKLEGRIQSPHLGVGYYGRNFNKDIRTRDDLIGFFELLNSRFNEDEQAEDMLLCFMPMYICRQYSKTKVDQINGYAHLCLGKFH